MDKVQRLKVEQSFFEDIEDFIKTPQKGKKKHEKVLEICKKYNISEKTLYNRIRSIFGKKLKDIKENYSKPSKQQVWEAIKTSNTAEEMWSKLNVTNKIKKGLLDEYFGKSTFQKCKLLEIEPKEKIKKYNPSIQDNIGFIVACRLGDAGFVKRSGNWSIRIEHSIKQKDWLIKKVELLRLSFSWMLNDVKITKRNTAFWYGGTFTSKKYNNLLDNEKHDLVKYLTPFGIFILFLDDGSNYITNKNQRVISFAVENEKIGKELIKYFKTYNLNFKLENKNCITIKSQYQVKSFLNIFILPFEFLIPESMKYKMIDDIV